MSEAPEQQLPGDEEPRRRWSLRWPTTPATATHRALLLTALGGLLIAGVTVTLPADADEAGRLAGYLDPRAVTSASSKASAIFSSAGSGDCLSWPDNSPDEATVVDCNDEHRFEVAEAVDMRAFPGSEYGPGAAPPSSARIQQISREQCHAAVKRYLGMKYDPNSKFVISMLWSGEKAWKQSGERRMLCGLQLPGQGGQQLVFTGNVADLDQSKVWPPGTCVGIAPSTNQPTDATVDCAAPHAMEVTGSVNLSEKFPGQGPPPERDQDEFIKATCTRLTEAYLAPVKLRATTLTLIYSTISLPSWSAGSHRVSCSIGATLGNGGWATLVGSAKGPLLINGQPPVAPPDIPEERLNPPDIPTTTTTTAPNVGLQRQPTGTSAPAQAGSRPRTDGQHSPGTAGPQSAPTAAEAPPPVQPHREAVPGAPPPVGPAPAPAPGLPPPIFPAPPLDFPALPPPLPPPAPLAPPPPPVDPLAPAPPPGP